MILNAYIHCTCIQSLINFTYVLYRPNNSEPLHVSSSLVINRKFITVFLSKQAVIKTEWIKFYINKLIFSQTNLHHRHALLRSLIQRGSFIFFSRLTKTLSLDENKWTRIPTDYQRTILMIWLSSWQKALFWNSWNIKTNSAITRKWCRVNWLDWFLADFQWEIHRYV